MLARRLARLAVAMTLAAPLGAQSAGDAPPPVAREFRASWIASVSNIDWPSRPGLSTAEQQAELRAILDRAARLGMNAVIFQVRPAADALYASPHEPWSEYLTGVQGRAPDPWYDPLAFAVAEAHARGLELHAWFNPYRAKHPSSRSPLATTHVANARPALVRTYGRHLWMDPGMAEVRRHSLRVVADVVARYDVDGVHIDDYFYPYKERDASGALLDFPDSTSYAAYRRDGGGLSRDDWRRGNVDRFVRELYAEVKRLKPHVKVGVSPFGIWRPGHPSSISGFDAYAEIYADARLWWREGWLDYLAPQLYWPIAQTAQSFPVLLDWWRAENVKGRHLWPGLYTSRVGGAGTPTWPADEIVRQVGLVRERRDSLAAGHIHFSERGMRTGREALAAELLRGDGAGAAPSPGRADTLRLLSARRDSMLASVAALYEEPALVPRTRWLDRTPPAAPRAALERDAARGTVLRLRPAVAGDVRWWVVQERLTDGWRTTIRPGHERSILIAGAGVEPGALFVRAVDRTGNESRAVRATPAR